MNDVSYVMNKVKVVSRIDPPDWEATGRPGSHAPCYRLHCRSSTSCSRRVRAVAEHRRCRGPAPRQPAGYRNRRESTGLYGIKESRGAGKKDYAAHDILLRIDGELRLFRREAVDPGFAEALRDEIRKEPPFCRARLKNLSYPL